MITLKYGKAVCTIPESWEELTPKQLVKGIQILSAEKDLTTAQLAFIRYLLPKEFKALMANFTPFELLELKSQFNFLAQKAQFERFVFERVRLPWTLIRLSGPSNSLANLTVREYGAAEHFLKHYADLASEPNMEERAEENLNNFLASIYWPKKNGERQVPKSSTLYHDQRKRNALKLAKLKPEVKQAIAFNFSACRDYVFSQFDEAFSRSGSQSKRDKYGWDGVVQHIAHTRHMIPDLIYNMNLIELLVQLDTAAIAENERETK